MASSTSLSSMPETTLTSPTRTGSTKCTLPCTVFLSWTSRANKFSAAMRAVKAGDPLDPAIDMGPLSSEEQRRTVLDQLEMIQHAGDKLIA